MKLKVDLFYYNFLTYESGLQCQSVGLPGCGNKIKVKTVVVDVPNDVELSEKEFDKAVHLSKLSEAERMVKIKREELTNAEEVVKNMMAIEHEGVDV